jgi:hypothetical protein
VSYDGEQFELALALRAGAGGHDHQGLGAVLGEQDLGVDVDAAEVGVDDGLGLPVALGDFLEFPQGYELGAAFLEFGDDLGGSGISAAGRQRGPQASRLGDQPDAKELVVERARFVRDAEANGTYDSVLARLSGA